MQVLLLLKSSDRVVHDICHAFDCCLAMPVAPIAHTLALRRWVPLRAQRELRCFVREQDLVGVPWPFKEHVLYYICVSILGRACFCLSCMWYC